MTKLIPVSMAIAFVCVVSPAWAQEQPSSQQLMQQAVALRIGQLELENAQLAAQVRTLQAQSEKAKQPAPQPPKKP